VPRSEAVRSIADAFVERLDEITERCLDAIWETVPSYERSGDLLRDDVREAVRQNVSTLADLLSEGGEVGRDELEPIERVGARRAEAAIPLEDVLHAYRTVSRVCWDALSEGCRAYRGDALDAAIELAETTLRYTDQISTAVADAYARAQRTIVREQEGARREFLADLLYGSEADPEDILRRAHTFGYDLSVHYIALVGESPENDRNKEAAIVAGASAAGLLGGSAGPIVLQKGDRTVALLPTNPMAENLILPEKLVAELGGGWRFGMAGPELGLEGIRRAYLEAREALEIGLALELEGPVYRFEDLILYHFLRVDQTLVDRFVDQMLGPLIDYDGRRKGELIKTLEAYFGADTSVKMAGQILFAHPHTVTYRIKQIERLTGWSLRDAEDKLRLQLALRAHRLSQMRRDIED
jgi:hypothetical protein